jgi:hypothetical protein
MEWVIGADFHQLKKIMSEIMDDFDAGKAFAQNKVLELMDEVIDEYRTLARAEKMDSESSKISKAQLNAVFFMKDWVLSGGHTDEDGNRVCLVW